MTDETPSYPVAGKLARGAVSVVRSASRLRFRGLARILYTVSPWIVRPGIHLVRSGTGKQLALDVTDYASCMMFYGRFSQEIMALLEELVAPGDVVMDVGAQIGYLTTILAGIVGPAGRVYSFEPDPNALARLRAAIAANELSQVTLFPVALGDKEGQIAFNVSPVLGLSTAVHNTHHLDTTSVQVQATTVDRLRAEGKIPGRVTLMKIDVEGFEVAVLDGANRLLADDRPLVIAELNDLMLGPLGKSSRDVLQCLIRHDYALYRIVQPEGLLSGGQVALVPLDPGGPMEFCDVLGVPKEKVGLLKSIRVA